MNVHTITLKAAYGTHCTEILMDGKPLHGAIAFELSQKAGSVATVHLTMYANVEAELEADVTQAINPL